MIKGEQISLTIDALADDGAGVGSAGSVDDPRRVHVPFALPGERVEAEVEHESPHRPEVWARLVRVTGPSPDRVAPACAAWGRCGGCVIQHLAYPAQLEWKRRQLAELLATVGLKAPVDRCVASPLELTWRNKSKLVVAREAGRVVLGGYAPRTHEVVDLAGCAVVELPIEDIAGVLRDLISRLGVRPYDEATGEGDLRHVVLRMNVGGEVLAVFVVARRAGLNVTELARTLREARPAVVGVVENLQPERSNVLYGEGEPDWVLDGVQAIEERIAGLRLRLSPRSFFQVNRGVAARLYADVATAAALGGGERALDVYSGVGGIALTLAATALEVVGLEESAQAVADARAGADLNRRANVRFHAGDAVALLGDRSVVGPHADVIVLNPPRKGCAREAIEACARLAPRTLLYVSCNPATLARDLAQLTTLGFELARVTPYDMMPHTPHVEALALLHRC